MRLLQIKQHLERLSAFITPSPVETKFVARFAGPVMILVEPQQLGIILVLFLDDW